MKHIYALSIVWFYHSELDTSGDGQHLDTGSMCERFATKVYPSLLHSNSPYLTSGIAIWLSMQLNYLLACDQLLARQQLGSAE